MTLLPIDYVNGISSLIYGATNIIVGLIIASKYFKLGDKNFLFIGLGFFGLSEAWIPSGISFLWNLMFNRGLTLESYVIIGNVFIPLCLLLWLIGISNLMNVKRKKLIKYFYIAIGILFEIIFFFLLILYPSLIGDFSKESPANIDFEYRTFILGYLLFCELTVLISTSLFARKSIQSKEKRINLKGKFILSSVILWTIGAILDTAIPLNLITLPITRIMLVTSGILIYIGFIMPPKITKFLLRKEFKS
ncbi:MAG: hypothetical protein EU541_01640 [Promethearchaeota archaeon]|nr:MAG: hypothetical protein EU541_01640 [Candidatus Lokiarchaeota archaeon]